MNLWSSYGDTPVSDDDQEALTDHARKALGQPVLKDAVQDLEQALQNIEAAEYALAVFEGRLTIEDLLGDQFLCELHGRLYADIWTWGGKYRNRVLSIGVFPEQIRPGLRQAMDDIRYHRDAGHWTPPVLGIAVHAHVVRIHPFTDGNGRVSRLLGDLVFLATQGDVLWAYDWYREGFDKAHYVRLLRAFDTHQDPHELADYIGIRPYGS